MEYLDLAIPHQFLQNDRNLQILALGAVQDLHHDVSTNLRLEVKYAMEKKSNSILRQELDTERKVVSRLRQKMVSDHFVQQNELNEEIQGNEIKLQEANDQCEKKINKFSVLLHKIVTKLSDIQGTIAFILNLPIKVDRYVLELD